MPFNTNIFNVDWHKLGQWALAPFTAVPEVKAMVYAIYAAIADIHTRFGHNRNYINYRLGITPQVCYLEKLLNDRFDVADRRIRIVKGVEFEPLVLFKKSEGYPEKLFVKSELNERVLRTKAETSVFAVDFIVRVPILVNFDMTEMRAYLDGDVLPGKVYKIQLT